MTDREIQEAAMQVTRLGVGVRRLAEACVVTVAVIVVLPAIGAATPVGLIVAVPALALIAVACGLRRHGMLDRLALVEEAYAIPAVARHGRRAASVRRRRVLAQRLDSIARDDDPDSLVVGDRVRRYRGEIDQIRRGLASSDASVAPPQVVACERLLTRCTESGLYNDDVPAEDLGAALRRIAAGIS
jgi:hypothetical protein